VHVGIRPIRTCSEEDMSTGIDHAEEGGSIDLAGMNIGTTVDIHMKAAGTDTEAGNTGGLCGCVAAAG
jgi:hypothetical protein